MTPDPGDLGRRVAARRQELRLTRAQLAARAGMSSGFVDYIETRPDAVIGMSSSALLRLATALETTPAELAGGRRAAPPGRGGGLVTAQLTAMDDDECWSHLRPGGIGRIVFAAGDELLVFPVNFAVQGREILFLTAPSGSLAAAIAAGARFAFEVDRLDEVEREGWSVLVEAEAAAVDEPERSRLVEETALAPWAGGERTFMVRMRPLQVTGRRITAAAG